MLNDPRDMAPRSSQFNGKVYVNERPVAPRGFRDVLRWRRTSKPARWPDWVETEVGPAPPKRVEGEALRITFVNHATVLVQTEGLNILTDPIWSRRCSPVQWAGPKRVHAPGIRFEDLPPIDVVLVSHNHYDHLDVGTLRRLAVDHAPRILIPLGNGALLRAKRITGGEETDWWDALEIRQGVKIHCVPVQHWSGRGYGDRSASLWSGFVIKTRAGPIYFAGDSGYGPHFAAARDRFGPMRLALLPIGAYEPRWFMKDMHMNPAETVQAHRDLVSRRTIAIHHGAFQLTDEAREAPQEALAEALARHSISDEELFTLEPGESRELGASSRGG